MSRNLLIEIKNNERFLEWGFFKYGGFGETALSLTKLIINELDFNKNYKEALEEAGKKYGYDKANMFISDKNKKIYNIYDRVHINIETKTIDFDGLRAYNIKDAKHFAIDADKLLTYDIEVLNIPFKEFDNFIYKLNQIQDDYYKLSNYPDRFIDNIEGM